MSWLLSGFLCFSVAFAWFWFGVRVSFWLCCGVVVSRLLLLVGVDVLGCFRRDGSFVRVGFALCSYRVLGFVSLTYFGSFGWFELACEFVRFGWLL